MTASPRPWVIGQFSGTGLHYYIDAANDDQVADVYEFDDAALCVRAVNSHDALVEALEWFGRHVVDPEMKRTYRAGGDLLPEHVIAALELAKGADRD